MQPNTKTAIALRWSLEPAIACQFSFQPERIIVFFSGEEIGELMKLSPEQLLLRWVNHQLEKVKIFPVLNENDIHYNLQINLLYLILYFNR